MGRPRVGQIPWDLIKAEWAAGATVVSLAAKYGVSEPGIYAHKKKNGWIKPGKELRTSGYDDLNWTQIAQSIKFFDLSTPQRDPDVFATILAKLSDGAHFNVAALRAGITPTTLYTWMKQDKAVKAACWKAKTWRITKNYENIAKAGDEGNWKASEALLRAEPLTAKLWQRHNSMTVNNTFMSFGVPRPLGEAIEGEYSEVDNDPLLVDDSDGHGPSTPHDCG